MFANLPNKLVTYIFEFLDLKDYNSILCVSRQFFSIINEHNKFWTRECFRHYISFDMEVYSDIYTDEEYKNCIKQKNFALPKRSWKKLLEEGSMHRKTFGAILREITTKENADNFLDYFDQILKQPPLPLAALKRETVVRNTQTLFQTKLSEVLYEDTSCLNQNITFPDCYKATIDQLKYAEKELLQQMHSCDKQEILRARWYFLGGKDGSQNKEGLSFGEGLKNGGLPDIDLDDFELPELGVNNLFPKGQYQNSLLIQLYDCLCNTISHFCTVVTEYFDSIENVYDLLAEYTARWNAYICTTLELERLFETFTEMLNTHYEAVLEGYPSYPKFSMWRLMTKIWMKEVFERSNFKLILNESFLRVLSNHREKNLKQAANNNFINLSFNEASEKYGELPKNLYVGLKIKRKKNSSIRYQSYEKLNNAPHVCFSDVMDLEKQLLSGFIQSILDISLNEVKIHYLNCSDIPTNYPYRELEECFIMKSNEFYSDYQHLFQESPDYFCHFLKSDCSLLSQILNERTNLKLETVQVQNGVQFMKNFIYQVLQKITFQDLQNAHVPTNLFDAHNNNGLHEFILTVVQEVLEEATYEQEKPACNDFYNIPAIEIEDEEGEVSASEPECCEDQGILALWKQNKNDMELMKRIVVVLESSHPEFRSNFEYLRQRLEHFEKIKERDNCIKEDNMNKNIPYQIGDIDSLFYDLDKNIDFGLLDKLYEDYKAYAEQQQFEKQQTQDINPMEEELPEIPGFGGNNNNFEGNQFNPDLMGGFGGDFQDIDLMTLPNLMRRMES